MQGEVKQNVVGLENRISTSRKPKGQLVVEQQDGRAKKYLEQLIIEMEVQQLAESIVAIKGRAPATERKQRKASPGKGSAQPCVQGPRASTLPILLQRKQTSKPASPSKSKVKPEPKPTPFASTDDKWLY